MSLRGHKSLSIFTLPLTKIETTDVERRSLKGSCKVPAPELGGVDAESRRARGRTGGTLREEAGHGRTAERGRTQQDGRTRQDGRT